MTECRADRRVSGSPAMTLANVAGAFNGLNYKFKMRQHCALTYKIFGRNRGENPESSNNATTTKQNIVAASPSPLRPLSSAIFVRSFCVFCFLLALAAIAPFAVAVVVCPRGPLFAFRVAEFRHESVVFWCSGTPGTPHTDCIRRSFWLARARSPRRPRLCGFA